MTAVAGNMGNQYKLLTGKNERLEYFITVPIGAAGAVGAVVADDAQTTATLNGTGDYTVTFPTAPSGAIGNCEVLSPAGTIKSRSHVAFDPTAGTWRFNTNNAAGAATQPASGDVIYLSLVLNLRG